MYVFIIIFIIFLSRGSQDEMEQTHMRTAWISGLRVGMLEEMRVSGWGGLGSVLHVAV